MRFKGYKTNERRGGEDSLVPLINIVFLILIFFLVASTIRPFTDRNIKLAESSETVSTGALQRTILMHRDGRLFVSGREIHDDGLMATLSEWRAEPDRAVTIVADRGADALRVAEIVASASGVGLKSIKLLTRRSRSRKLD